MYFLDFETMYQTILSAFPPLFLSLPHTTPPPCKFQSLKQPSFRLAQYSTCTGIFLDPHLLLPPWSQTVVFTACFILQTLQHRYTLFISLALLYLSASLCTLYNAISFHYLCSSFLLSTVCVNNSNKIKSLTHFILFHCLQHLYFLCSLINYMLMFLLF